MQPSFGFKIFVHVQLQTAQRVNAVLRTDDVTVSIGASWALMIDEVIQSSPVLRQVHGLSQSPHPRSP